MKKDMFIDIMSNIDDSLIEKYAEEKEKFMKVKRKKAKRLRYATVVGAVACLVLVFGVALPMIGSVPGKGNTTNPNVTVKYSNVAEAEAQLNYKTLYSNISLTNSRITVTFKGKDDATPDYDNPITFRIQQIERIEKNTKEIVFGLYYDINDYESVKIKNGTEKAKPYNGITVYIVSKEIDNLYKRQAMFVYDNHVYVVEILLRGYDEMDIDEMLDEYLNIITKQ